MNQFKLRISTLFGIGLLPGAPGTWGSLAVLPVIYLLALYGNIWLLLFILITSLITIWISPYCEEVWGTDPGKVVIDEAAGQAIPFLLLPLRGDLSTDIWYIIAAFLLFRLFDILKPLGIKRLQHLKGGFGILTDDLLAGIYAMITLQVVARLILGYC
jgi:phosphatidylglycerophosphatase A